MSGDKQQKHRRSENSRSNKNHHHHHDVDIEDSDHPTYANKDKFSTNRDFD